MESAVDTFMKSPLTTWIQTFCVEPVTYTDLCDGAFLVDVMQQICMPSSTLAVSVISSVPPVDDVSDKLMNWIALIESIQVFYQTVLREYIVLPLPDVLKIYLQSESAADDIQLTLLLMLGCAVHCERKEVFIEKIKKLDINLQQDIVECIKKVTDVNTTVLPIDLTLADDTARLLHRHIGQLLQQRSNELARFASLKDALYQSKHESSSLSTTYNDSLVNQSSPEDESHVSSAMRDPLSVIRALRQQLDEKNVDVADLTEELNDLRLSLQKLKTENVELVQEARTSRVYRDELDCLRDKASRADKYEVELAKLRERLHELDFVKLRIEELRTENHLLLETKQELEYQLSMKEAPMTKVIELEKEINRSKLLLEQTYKDLEVERRKRQDLVEENARLEVINSDTVSQLALLGERSKSSVTEAEDGVGTRSLSDQVSETTKITLLQLELENKRLLRKLQLANHPHGNSVNGRKSGDHSSINGSSSVFDGTTEDHDVNDDDPDDKLINSVGSHAMTVKSSANRSSDVIDGRFEEDLSPVIAENGVRVRATAVTPSVSNGTIENDEVKDHLKEINELQRIVTDLRAAQERYADVERRSVDNEAENARLRRKLETVEKSARRCDELQQTVARLTFDLETQRRAAGRVADLSATVAESEIEIDGLRRLVDELRSSVDSSQNEADRAERDLSDLTADRDRLKRHADAAAVRTADLQRRCDELSTENARLRRSGDVMADAVRRLEKRLEELTSDVEAAGVEKATLIDRIGELEEEYQSTGEVAEMRCRTAEQRVDELERRIEEMTRERQVDRNAVTRLRQELVNERLRLSRVSHSQRDELAYDKKQNDSDISNSFSSNGSHALLSSDVSVSTTSNHESVDPTSDAVEAQVLKDRLISLERQNAAMEEERRILRQRCTESEALVRTSESSNLRLTADLSSARGQISAVQPRLDRLESDHAAATQRCAELETRNSSLAVDCDRLRAKIGRVGDELRIAVANRSELEREVDDIRRRHDQQAVELDRLRAERSAAESARSLAETELGKMTDRFQRLTVDRDELMQWKSANEERRRVSEDRVLGDDELVDEMTAEVLQTNVRLEAERDRVRDEVEQLNAELKETKNERNRWRQRCEMLSDEISESHKRLTTAELECSKLENKCDSLFEMNGKLDEERQMLMKQLQSMMNQVQELLTELISSKDSYASDQKSYLQQLAELRRQKEKLEEKIMEQYKSNTSSKKKNKGFGAVIVRTARNVMSRGRSKSDLRPTSATEMNASETDLRRLNEVESPSTGDLSAQGNARPKSPSHRSTSSDEPTQTSRWDGSTPPPPLPSSGMRPARSSVDVYPQSSSSSSSKTVSWYSTEGTTSARCHSVLFEDETITLDQFLAECNQSPISRKQMLVKKNGNDVIATPNKPIASSRQSHWTSLLSLFHSSPTPSQQTHQQRSHHEAAATPTTSRHILSNSTPSIDVQLSHADSSSSLNLTTTSPEQTPAVDADTDEPDLERRQRQRQRQADNALDRLDWLVTVDIEPPPLSNGDSEGDTSKTPEHLRQARPDDIGRRVPVTPTADVEVASRVRDMRSARSSSSSTASECSRSASGQSDSSVGASRVLVPRPRLTMSNDAPGSSTSGMAAVNEAASSPAIRRLVGEDHDPSSFSARSSSGGTSAGSSSGRSVSTPTTKSHVTHNNLPARLTSSSTKTVDDDVSANRKFSNSDSSENRGELVGLSSEQVAESSSYRESSVCI